LTVFPGVTFRLKLSAAAPQVRGSPIKGSIEAIEGAIEAIKAIKGQRS
jgi:hypothetical protein